MLASIFILRPLGDRPGFTVPVLKRRKTVTFSRTWRDGVILGVSIASISCIAEHSTAQLGSITVSAGEAELFAFFTKEGTDLFGSAAELRNYLSDHFYEYANLPFLQLDIAEFLDDQRLLVECRRRIAALEPLVHSATNLSDWTHSSGS